MHCPPLEPCQRGWVPLPEVKDGPVFIAPILLFVLYPAISCDLALHFHDDFAMIEYVMM